MTIEHGHANCLSDDYASVAYWYQTEPHQPFEPMPPVGERLPIDERESLHGFMRTISSPPESTSMRRNKHQRVSKLLLDRRSQGDIDWPGMSDLDGEWADRKSANKFMLGSVLSQMMDADRVWENARRFAEDELGDPDDLWDKIIAIPDWDSDEVRRRYHLHWLSKAHERVRRIGKEIVERYDGDARNIWDDQVPFEVLNRLNGMQVGPETSWHDRRRPVRHEADIGSRRTQGGHPRPESAGPRLRRQDHLRGRSAEHRE